MKIAILGCGKIAHRIAQGIKASKATLYAAAARDISRAKEFAAQYEIEHFYDYETCLNDPNVDLIYIATINPTHFDLIKRSIEHHKHVLCEKPMVKSQKEVNELFELAQKHNVFLMEAHKGCFTALQEEMLKRLLEIGKIQTIEAAFNTYFDPSHLNAWNLDPQMGGSFYDVGVYPLAFTLLYANSEIKDFSFNVFKHLDLACDFNCECYLSFENGIQAKIKSSWNSKEDSFAIIQGEKGSIKIQNFWKNTVGYLNDEMIEVSQISEFTGQVNEAINCITNGKLQSSRMSQKMSATIAFLLEEMKKVRDQK